MTASVTNRASDLAVLWEPLDIGPVTVRNRVALNPLTTLWAEHNVLSDRHLAYYTERARGGIGLIISEQHVGDRDAITAFEHASSATDPRSVPALARVADAVHEHGATMFVQLYGAGVQDSAGVGVDTWHPLWGPSAMPSSLHGDGARVMGASEIHQLRSAFARAARHVEVAGMDGVELHAAHGWLFHRFLSRLWNRRADAYGGSPANRARLVLETAESVRAATSGLALGIQLSVDDYRGDSGQTPDDTDELLTVLADSGLFDYVNLSAGNEFSNEMAIPPMEIRNIPSGGYGLRAKGVVGDRMKVLVGGGVERVERAAGLVRDGHADLVALTRPHFADPHIVRKARAGRLEEIRPCIGSNECFRRAATRQSVICLMNPATGRERTWGSGVVQPRRRSRRVVIVGAGPAGLQAAIAAVGVGHEVTLFERAESPGGHLALLAGLPNRERWTDAIKWFERSARTAGVDIRLGTEATAQTSEILSADVVLCATGSTWQRTGVSAARPEVLDVPGAGADNVLDIATATRRAIADAASLGRRVVVIDETGDYLPLGLADVLAAAGTQVVVATRLAAVGLHVVTSSDHTEVFKRLARGNAQFVPGHLFDGIEPRRVYLREAWSGRQTCLDDVDTVVLAILREGNTDLYDAISGVVVDSRLIGDALAPRRTAEVIHEGQKVGSSI